MILKRRLKPCVILTTDHNLVTITLEIKPGRSDSRIAARHTHERANKRCRWRASFSVAGMSPADWPRGLSPFDLREQNLHDLVPRTPDREIKEIAESLATLETSALWLAQGESIHPFLAIKIMEPIS